MSARQQAGLTLTLGGTLIGLFSDGGAHLAWCIVVALIGVIVLASEKETP